MGITISDKRVKTPQTLNLSSEVSVVATGSVTMNIPFIIKNMDFFSVSFKIELEGKTVFIDPVGTEEKGVADYILITHNHMDHFSIKDIRTLCKEKATIICPKGVYKKVAKKLHTMPKGVSVIQIRPMECKEFEGIIIKTVPSYNVKKSIMTAHPIKAENVGYIINYKGFSVFHAGDSDVVPEMKDIGGLTVAIVPIDGDGLTMSTEHAIDLINHLKPQYVIPAHYRIGTDELRKFRNGIKESIQVKIMDGQEYNG